MIGGLLFFFFPSLFSLLFLLFFFFSFFLRTRLPPPPYVHVLHIHVEADALETFSSQLYGVGYPYRMATSLTRRTRAASVGNRGID